MKTKKFLIAGGNSTLLVWDCLSLFQEGVIKEYLGEVEQIGFVSNLNGIPKLTMMGNELCINGTIALSSQLGKEGKIYTSRTNKQITCRNTKNMSYINIEINYISYENTVLLSGIGFIYLRGKPETLPVLLRNLGIQYKIPPFGEIIDTNSTFQPYVYVVKTNSLFKETVCGSASIVLNILKGFDRIQQPTGETITVKRRGNRFNVSAEVKKTRV